MKREIYQLVRNPLALFLTASLVAIGIIALSENEFFKTSYPFWGAVLGNLAEAIFTAGAFGVIFDFFSKKSLILEAVQLAVGQRKALDLGLLDAEVSTDRVNYSHDLQHSQSLYVSTRYADHFFQRNRGDILSRVDSGRAMSVLVMKDGVVLNAMPGFSTSRQSAIDFIKRLCTEKPARSPLFAVYAHPNPMSYNFVKVDRGIWVKFYWNSSTSRLPPAMFVAAGTPLHATFDQDISDLIAQASKVPL